MILIKDIEDAIITALAGSDLAAICKSIETYHGEVEDLVAELKTSPLSPPAVRVCYVGSGFDEAANRSWDDEATFAVITIAKDLRGRGALRTGVYEMLEIEKDTLINSNLGLDIRPLNPVNIEALVINPTVSVFGFRVNTIFAR